MANEKIKISFDTPYFIVVQTSDKNYLMTDRKGQSRVAKDGEEMIKIIRDIFNIDKEKEGD